jgi:hypothetical protein
VNHKQERALPIDGALRLIAPLAAQPIWGAVRANLGSKVILWREVGAMAPADNNGPRGAVESAPAPQPVGIPDVLDRPSGYHQLQPDVSVNFQLNRWLSWMTPQALSDVAAAAARARDYPELTSAFLDLGDRLLAQGRNLDAAFCYRAAEFFLLPGDQRRAPTRRRFLQLIRGVYGIGPQHLTHVPYQGSRLPTYRFGSPRKGAWSSSAASTATSRSSSP